MIQTERNFSKGIATLFIVILLIAAGIAVYYFTSVKQESSVDAKKKRFDKPQSVVIAQVKTNDVNISIKALGTIVPTTTVNVKTQVDGQLVKIFFREGAYVKAGEKLALVDPRPFEVSLEQTQGQLAKDQALLENAKIDMKRYEDLKRQNSVSTQVYDTQKALVHQYEGIIKVDQSAVKNAKLQLSYCTIRSPISGKAGLRLVDLGNMVHPADQNGIVTITSLQPITALFTITQADITSVTQRFQKGQKLVVDAYDKEDTTKLQSGLLVSVDNQIDPTTGTLKLRAEFANKDMTLFPNQFVNIHLLTQTLHDAITIPQAAIQTGAKGTFVYVVDANKSVHVREVKSSYVQDGMAVIQEGLTAGEMIVIDGLDRLKEGAKVIPSQKDAANGKRKHGFKKEQ